MGLMLYPGLIKTQAKSVNTILKADNAALMAAREKINDFLNADMLQGAAWDKMRSHLRHHLSIVQGLLAANSKLQEADDKLSEQVGSEILIEDVLKAQIRILKNINEALRRRIESLSNQINSSSDPTHKAALRAIINGCREIIRANEKKIRELEEKLAKLFRIEASTANLFDEFESLYNEVNKGIAAIRQEWNPDVSDFHIGIGDNDSWKKALADAWEKLSGSITDKFGEYLEELGNYLKGIGKNINDYIL